MSAQRFVLRAAAQRDINGISEYLQNEADRETALRFVDAAQAAFNALGEAPNLGPAVRSRNAALTGLRKWRVAGFRSYLIFYRPEGSRIRILRVLHTSQDWWSLLDVE